MATSTFDFEQLRKLSVAERLQLVEDLWDSIAQDAPDEAFPLTEAVATELDRRVAEADANPASGATWDEVYARITDPARRRPPRS